MKSMSFAKRAVALAVLSTAAIGASAAVYDLGAITVGTPKSFNGGAAGNSVVVGDLFAFSLPTNGGTQYDVINFPLTFAGLNFSLSFAALYANPDGNVTGFNGDEGTALHSELAAGNAVHFSYPAPAGDYFLLVSGVTTGTNGGAYSGYISAAPVPEPESYAMFLAGLGIMGAIAARRNKAKKG